MSFNSPPPHFFFKVLFLISTNARSLYCYYYSSLRFDSLLLEKVGSKNKSIEVRVRPRENRTVAQTMNRTSKRSLCPNKSSWNQSCRCCKMCFLFSWVLQYFARPCGDQWGAAPRPAVLERTHTCTASCCVFDADFTNTECRPFQQVFSPMKEQYSAGVAGPNLEREVIS